MSWLYFFVLGGLSTVQPRINSKQPVAVVGYNEHAFLIKTNKVNYSYYICL